MFNNDNCKLLFFVLVFYSISSAQEVVKITEDAPIFSRPQNNSRVIALAAEGEKAQILGYKNRFYHVRYSSFGKEYTGYIHQSKVSIVISSTNTSELSALKVKPRISNPKSSEKGVTVIHPNLSKQGDNFFFTDFLWILGTAGAIYGGYELMQTGYVVLGRDIMAGSLLTWIARSRLVKNLSSWGNLDQIEVKAHAYDVTGEPRWIFSPAENGQIVLTLINRGEKRIKGIKPTINLESNVLDKQFGKIKTKKGKSEGLRRYFVGRFMLNPGEMMTTSVSFEIPATYPATTLEVKGSLSRSIYGTAPLEVERAGPETTFATAATKSLPAPSVAIMDVEKKIPKGKENPDAYGVVFGIEEYKNVSPVTFAKRDAYWAREYFEKTLGIPEGNIYYLTDSDVSKAEFDKVFSPGGWLDKRIRDGMSDIYFYYAGHGAPDISNRTAYLIPYDGDPNYASQTGYKVDLMTGNLSQLGSRSVTVFLDACFSGANRESEALLAGARPVFMEVNPGMAENVTLFSAASGTEISSVWPEKQHGIFTYWMLKGLQGNADANRDRSLTVNELGDFIRENVRITAGKIDREQTPGLQTMDRGKILVKY